MAKQHRFDQILMDIQMPIMDGYQAMQQLKQMKRGVPVFALTAHALKEERDRCLALGFSGFITKPINRLTLLQTICEALDKGSEV